MASRKQEYSVIALVLIAAAGAAVYFFLPSSASGRATPLMGVVRTTQIRVAPEVGGQLAAIKVQKCAHVRASEVIAELSALELTASVGKARAALAVAVALRDRAYAGVRVEQVATLSAEVVKANDHRKCRELQLARKSGLARGANTSQQSVDIAQKEPPARGLTLRRPRLIMQRRNPVRPRKSAPSRMPRSKLRLPHLPCLRKGSTRPLCERLPTAS
jgi:multidrug resistance efflux pump